MQGPENFLSFAPSFTCPVTKKEAPVTALRRAMVNHEIYYVSDAKALERFRRHPLRYCGIVTDPVNRARFRPSSRSRRFDWKGRPYFFAGDSTFFAFRAMPDSFAQRKGM